MNAHVTNGDEPIAPIVSLGVHTSRGLTKREFFAVELMKGFISNPAHAGWAEEQSAAASVQHADALIRALNK